MTEIKKEKDDPGEIILRKDGTPICSAHGDVLWIEEKNVADNSAFCMHSDSTIYASKKVKLLKQHITMKNVPSDISKIIGDMHEE